MIEALVLSVNGEQVDYSVRGRVVTIKNIVPTKSLVSIIYIENVKGHLTQSTRKKSLAAWEKAKKCPT